MGEALEQVQLEFPSMPVADWQVQVAGFKVMTDRPLERGEKLRIIVDVEVVGAVLKSAKPDQPWSATWMAVPLHAEEFDE